MDDYSFNEDDLIADYIENNDESYPEPEDYDEFEEPQEEEEEVPPHDPVETDDHSELNRINGAEEREAGLDGVPAAITTSARNRDRSADLYEFERYSPSTWRTAKTVERGGATTMEATKWKKVEPNKGDVEDSDDDLDNRATMQVRAKRVDVAKRGAEAQLVRSARIAEEEMMGRSWGRKVRDDGRFVYREEGRPKIGEDSVVVTVADGTTVNVKLKKERSAIAKEGDGKKECLLGMPLEELVRRADVLQKRAIKRKLEREGRTQKKGDVANNKDGEDADDSAAVEDEVNNQDEAMEDVQPDPDTDTQTAQSLKQKQHRREMLLRQRLWVDKHAPSSISHLLSDERTNREVLRALRMWDPYVFKREAPKRPVAAWQQQQQNAQKYQQGGEKKKTEKKKEGEESGDGKDQKADVRPDENSRVILLSGPPGVGKSTLAHIVCKHAGYRPVEVNASDERSASALTERVTRAMESSTLNLGEETSKSGRPNCIILDEVDGADAKSAISALVEIVKAEIPAKAAKGKKSKKAQTHLRRPIILICNHKHAPALRPILPYCRQFDVQPPNPERLTARLKAVLASEHMSCVAGGMLLHRLVASTGGDVRSCLYALQFASARARELDARKREREGIPTGGGAVVVDLSSTLMAALGDTGNGMKDMQSDVSNTVATVFRKDKSKGSNKRQKVASGRAVPTSEQKGVNLVLKAVDHFGDNSKTLDCLFMNVNRVGYVDPTLDRCSVAFDWLSSADMYRSMKSSVAMNNTADHHSMQKYYMPSAAAAIHLLCCIETRPDLTFSTRELADLHYQNQANVSLVHRFVEGLTPKTRSGIGGGTDTVVSDVIPYGLWLLSAGNGKHSLSKPVSSIDILSPEEKLAFSAHVDTLRALGLTYVKDDRDFQSYKANAAYENIRLEPEIDKLVKFDHSDEGYSLERKQVPPVLRELLAHGATVAALRERESDAKIAQDAAQAPAEKQQKEAVNIDPIAPEESGAKAEKRKARSFLNIGAAKAKEAKSARRAARVGFDRSKKVKLSNTGSGVELSKVIRFKFQKGFTQAVQAPCQIQDLL